MKLRRWLPLLLLALPFSASAISPPPGASPVYGRIASTPGTWTLAEIEAQLGASTPRSITGGTISRVLPQAGKFIRWGGAVGLAAYVVNDSMQWFYDTLKHSADSAYDDWYNRLDGADAPFNVSDNSSVKYHADTATFLCNVNRDGLNGSIYRYYYEEPAHPQFNKWNYGYISSSNPHIVSSNLANSSYCTPQTLSNFLDSHPGSSATVGNIVSQYLQNHPEAARPLASPAPNDNQWFDNPYANPTLDTDGDGIPDPVEYESPDGDPNDATKRPQGAPYETGRNTTITRNADGSTTSKTDIKYSDGKTASESITTKTEIITNPDGSTTIRTTTTTSTTDRDGKTTTRTSTNQRTSPGNAPGPLPVGAPSPYTGPNPTGDDDADGIPNDRDRSPYGPGGTPSSPVPSSPVDDSNAPKPSDPDYKNPDLTKDEDQAKKDAEAKLKKEQDQKDKDEAEKLRLKEREEARKEQCRMSLGIWDAETGCSPDPDKDKKDCEKMEGQQYDAETKTCEKKKDEPLENHCGDFTIPRLLQHTASYLKDVVFPCPGDDMGWQRILDGLHEKFPFSIISSMNNIVSVGDGASDNSNSLPTQIGPFTLDFTFANTFFSFIRVAFRALIWALFMSWLLGRVSGQVTLS